MIRRFVFAALLLPALAAAQTQVFDPAAFPPELQADAREIAQGALAAPTEAAVLYQIAALRARAGQTEAALAALRQMAATGAGLDPRPREFPTLQDNPNFQALVAEIRAANPPALRAQRAFTIDEGDLIPEGIAWSNRTQLLYLGSVKRKIVAAAPDGKLHELVAPAAHGLGVVGGLRIDDRRGEIWAVSMPHPKLAPDGVSGLFRFRLADGALLGRYPVGGGAQFQLNDVALTPDGRAFATASNSGAIVRVTPETNAVDVFLPPDSVPSANGIVATPDGNFLFVAGWYGITRVDLKLRTTLVLQKPANISTGCIDGLYLHGTHRLVGVQNCVHTSGRVLRYELGPNRDTILRATVLESYNPLFNGITTGAVAGDQFYFIANTQLRRGDDVGKPDAGFDKLQMLRLKLNG